MSLKLLTGRNPQLRLHHIHAGDGFGDRVLHLDARIHFDEVKIVVRVHQELDGSGILIADVWTNSGRALRRSHPGSSA